MRACLLNICMCVYTQKRSCSFTTRVIFRVFLSRTHSIAVFPQGSFFSHNGHPENSVIVNARWPSWGLPRKRGPKSQTFRFAKKVSYRRRFGLHKHSRLCPTVFSNQRCFREPVLVPGFGKFPGRIKIAGSNALAVTSP